MIDQLRISPDRWKVGVQLFFDGHTEISRFFGLSLIREFLSSLIKINGSTVDPQVNQIHQTIRDAMWSWTSNHIAQGITLPTFILNNLVTVLTLLIKRDFPER